MKRGVVPTAAFESLVERECGIKRKPGELPLEFIGRAVNLSPDQLRRTMDLVRDGVDLKEAERIARLTA